MVPSARTSTVGVNAWTVGSAFTCTGVDQVSAVIGGLREGDAVVVAAGEARVLPGDVDDAAGTDARR